MESSLLSSILIEVIILYDFVFNYLSLSSIAKSNILSRHFLISAAPMIAFRFPEREPRSNEPTDLASRPEYRLGNWTGSLAIKSRRFRICPPCISACLQICHSLFIPSFCSACQSFKFRCNVGIHYAFKQGHCRQTIS